MWGLHIDYNISAVGHIYVKWQAYLFGAYDDNVKFMYTSASGHIIDCSELV